MSLTWWTHHHTLLPTTPAQLSLYIWSVFDILEEVADVAAYFFAGFQAEWDNGDEAEREPFPKACLLATIHTAT